MTSVTGFDSLYIESWGSIRSADFVLHLQQILWLQYQLPTHLLVARFTLKLM